VSDPITEPKLFKGQVVRIYSNSTSDLAVLAQVCEIHGKIEGKLYFRGQMLIIQPSGEVTGGVDATAQMVQRFGKVEGGITGEHQLVEMPPPAPPAE